MFRFDASPSTMICSALAVAGVGVACFSDTRLVMAGGVIVAYLASCVGVFRVQRRRSRQMASIVTMQEETSGAAILIAYASQTGFAEQLAVQTAQLLDRAGQAVHVEPLDTVGLETLTRYRRALFIVSTTGEGDAPDNAASFVRKAMSVSEAPSLRALRYGVLALGDRNYQEFCAFGHAVDRWLSMHRAEALFPLIEMNNGEPAAWRSWQTCLSALASKVDDNALPSMSRTHWTLSERTLLNPGSAANPAFHVCLKPADPAALNWQAGDIAEICPQHPQRVVSEWMRSLSLDGDVLVECDGESCRLSEALATRTLPVMLDCLRGLRSQAVLDALDPLPSRQYSISSLPADGRLELLVRQLRYPDVVSGSGVGLGLASGWLTQHASPGTSVSLRVRTNRGFHAPEDDRPLILIGAGTGLAGLRAHLKHRAARGQRRNWLIFGERHAAHDALHADELAQWQADGVLHRLDKVWSRDGGEHRYVHDAIRAAADRLRQWVEDGASIYVCGSAQRMAPTVHAALLDILGEARVDGLREAGRYRRDVH